MHRVFQWMDLMRISMGGEADLSDGTLTGTVVVGVRSESGWKRDKRFQAAERGRGEVGHTHMDMPPTSSLTA